MSEPDEESPFEPPEVNCAAMIVCRAIWYDAEKSDDGYSLGGVVVHIRPPAGVGYGYTEPRLFLYTQLFGTPGEYTIRVRLTRVTDDGEGDTEERTEWGPWDVFVTGESFVESFGMSLPRVPFDDPGVYEFQLWIDGKAEPAGTVRIEAREDV